MTAEHMIFIPTVFLLGVLTGILTTVRQKAGLSVLLSLALALTVFAFTHLVDVPFGAKAVREAAGGLALLDQSPAFSADAVIERLELFGAAGRAVYQRAIFTGDLIFPLSLLAFFLMLARFVIHHLPGDAKGFHPLYLLPLTWFAADMIENTIIFALIAGFPDSSTALATLLGPLTALKLALLPAVLAVPMLTLGVYRVRARHAA